MQSEIDGIDVFPPERSIHDRRRESMDHGVAGDAVDPCRRVHLFNSVKITQFLRRHLPGSALFIGAEGSESEDAAGSHSQHSADDALFSHAYTDQGMLVTLLRQKPDHGD